MYKVFTKPNCQFCVRAKELLDKLNIPYETYHLGNTTEGGTQVGLFFTPSKILTQG